MSYIEDTGSERDRSDQVREFKIRQNGFKSIVYDFHKRQLGTYCVCYEINDTEIRVLTFFTLEQLVIIIGALFLEIVVIPFAFMHSDLLLFFFPLVRFLKGFSNFQGWIGHPLIGLKHMSLRVTRDSWHPLQKNNLV